MKTPEVTFMSTSNRIFRWSGLVLGGLGVLGCAALTVGVWVGKVRLSRTAEAVFGKVDGMLGVVRQGIGRTRDRVEGARVTSEEVGETLKKWTKREVGRRVAERLEVEEKAARVGETLAQADRWMETSAASVELVSEVIASANEAGASVPTETLQTVEKEIGEIRGQLEKAAVMVAEVQNLTAAEGGAQPPAGRLEKAARIALRLAASLGVIEKGFSKIEGQLGAVEKGLDGAERRLQGWIVFAAVGLTLVLVWMAAGQGALVWVAGRGCERRKDEG